MCKLKYVLSMLAIALSVTCCVAATHMSDEMSSRIPEMKLNSNKNPNKNPRANANFNKHADAAQYGNGDWSGIIGISRGISEAEAIEIAKSNPEVTFFFYTKGMQMVLVDGKGKRCVFRHGDAVFFK